VVLAVDGTDGSAGALRYAAAQAAARGSAVHVVHAPPSYVAMSPWFPYVPEDLTSTGESILRHAASSVCEAAPGVPVTSELLRQGRVPGLVAVSAGVDLLVLGQESRHGVHRVLPGATTTAVAAHAHCPVVVVPADWEIGEASGVVVVGVKSEHDADRLLARAFAEATTRGAGLRIVHAWDLPSPYADRIEQRTHASDWRASGEAHLESLLTRWREANPDVPVEVHVVHAQPRDALVDAAHDADLVIMLRHRSPLLPGTHLGGTARAVLALSPVPVEVVPVELSRGDEGGSRMGAAAAGTA
jgi:nucleotide-binding universal stress UspA family protein